MKKATENLKDFFIFLLNFKNTRYYWSHVIIVLTPILFVLFPDLPSYIAYNWISIGVFIIVMIICVLFSLNVSKELIEKIEDAEELKHANFNLTTFLQTTPERVIKSIFNYLGFGYNERITVYRYDGSHFVQIGRYAKNLEYKKGGRGRYPYSEGFIGIAWQSGEFEIEGLPDPIRKNKGYINEVKSKCNIEESIISNMRMKSRSYYCINLDNHGGDPIAVIVFESTDEKLPKKAHEIKYLLESSFGHLIVDMINMNLPLGRRKG